MATLQSFLSSRLENLRSVAGGGFSAACPACRLDNHDSEKNHLRIYSSGAYVCSKYKGDKLHNKAIYSIVFKNVTPEILASLELSIVDPDPKIEADKIYPEDMLSRLIPDHSYWVNRGINEEVLRKLEGGLAPPEELSKVTGRYMFPIRDHQSGKIIGWTGRLVSEESFGPKHKHLVRVKRAVYPLWHNKEAILRARKVVFVEGQGDLLACMTAGIDYTINLLGLNLNSRMLGFLASAGLDELIVSTNNDSIGEAKSEEAGNKASKTICSKLLPFFGESKIKVRLPTTKKDWCKVLEDKTGELEVFKAELEGEIKLTDEEIFTL